VSKPVDPPVAKDAIGYPIPTERLAIFQRTSFAELLLNKLADVRGAVRRAMENDDLLFRECKLNEVMIELDNIYAELKRAVPYVVCPTCQGIYADACRTCNGRGVISKFLWDNTISYDVKTNRIRCLETKT
jgi:hypothetical protein